MQNGLVGLSEYGILEKSVRLRFRLANAESQLFLKIIEKNPKKIKKV